MTLENGDYLERTHVGFIRSYIPVYESTWKRYIGHNGAGMMPEIKKLN